MCVQHRYPKGACADAEHCRGLKQLASLFSRDPTYRFIHNHAYITHTYIHTYIRTYIHTHIHTSVCMYVCIYVFMYVYVCVCMYVCLHVCVCMCVYICICIYLNYASGVSHPKTFSLVLVADKDRVFFRRGSDRGQVFKSRDRLPSAGEEAYLWS